MKLSGAEIIIKLLENEGVKYVSGIPGGFNLPIYDALYESLITHILARHEQGAAFIAQGISRSTDDVGVCFATSGPGATNLITAIADAKLDSIPLVAITGQVPLSAIGTDAFQEVDAFGLFMPICKHNYLIKDIMDLFTVIPDAFRIAKEGRPGPVLIDIPKDIQTSIIEINEFPTKVSNKCISPTFNLSKIKEIASVINNSYKPIIYAGGGIITAKAYNELSELAHKSNIPVALTLMGLTSLNYDDNLNLGMLGMHANPHTNYLIDEADLIIALGVRFDDRATGKIQTFAPNASIIHVDIDSSEINKLRSTSYSLVADVKYFLKEIIPYIKPNSRTEWLNHISDVKNLYYTNKYDNIIHPTNLITTISNLAPENSIICTDVGQHQMWTAQKYNFNTNNTFLTSGGLGTMGFGLPAAIGAALSNKDKTVILFSGDGSILMNIQELATLADYKLNIKIILFINRRLGLVKQQQELFFNKHYIASSFIENPDFITIATGFGINSINLSLSKNPIEDLNLALLLPSPYLITIDVDDADNVFPMVVPGSSNLDMIGVNKY